MLIARAPCAHGDSGPEGPSPAGASFWKETWGRTEEPHPARPHCMMLPSWPGRDSGHSRVELGFGPLVSAPTGGGGGGVRKLPVYHSNRMQGALRGARAGEAPCRQLQGSGILR